MEDSQLGLRETLSQIGRRLLDREWEHLAFLYLQDSSHIKSWVQLMRELVDKKYVTNSKKDLSRLMKYLKEIRRESLNEIVEDYQSGLVTQEVEKNTENIKGFVIAGTR